jgi:hypothetical protein
MPAPLPALAYGGDYNAEQWPCPDLAEDDRSWAVAINHGTDAATVPLDWNDLVGRTEVSGELTLAVGGVAVIRET